MGEKSYLKKVTRGVVQKVTSFMDKICFATHQMTKSQSFLLDDQADTQYRICAC